MCLEGGKLFELVELVFIFVLGLNVYVVRSL